MTVQIFKSFGSAQAAMCGLQGWQRGLIEHVGMTTADPRYIITGTPPSGQHCVLHIDGAMLPIQPGDDALHDEEQSEEV